MSYAHVVGGIVKDVGEIPTSWTLASGQSVSGFNRLPALWAGEGWLPVVETRHAYDPATEQEGGPVYTVGASNVTADYPIGPRPAADINADVIRTKGGQAIDTNVAYLATLPGVAAKITTARTNLATGKARATTGKAAAVTTFAQAQTEVRAAWTIIEGLCGIIDDTLTGLGDAVTQTGVLARENTAVLRLLLDRLDTADGT